MLCFLFYFGVFVVNFGVCVVCFSVLFFLLTSTTTISNYKIKKLVSKSQQNDKKASHTDVSAPSQRDTKCAAAARGVAGQACDRRAGENDQEAYEKEGNATAER